MSNMARTTSASSMKGFSVLQPTLGAPLSWMPAVGSKELEHLINAYLPGPASAQEKRATISVDFFEFAAQTGENFKYYPVPVTAPQATPSPANSAFTTSPAMSSMSYGSPSQPSTPAPRTASRTPAVKAEKTDYSHLPGMKILTADGQDVTNSVSRGCKSKEQREHAHLMRVLKACDACKKKKIRCDPSHKRRTSSHVSAKPVSKPAAKKAKKASAPVSEATPAICTPAPETSFELDLDVNWGIDLDDGFPSMDIDDILAFNPEPTNANMHQDFYGAVPQDFDFFLSNDLSPTMASSTGSFDSPAQPLTPVGSGLLPQGDFTAFHDTSSLAYLQTGGQEPILPYLTPGAHGSNYVDFNLYSPDNSFVDEEPQKLKARGNRQDSVLQSAPASPQSHLSDANQSPASFNEARSSTGLANGQQWRVNRSGSTTLNPQEPQWQVPGDQLQQNVAGDDLTGGLACQGDQRPFHGENGGHDSGRTTTATRPRGLQQQHQQTMHRTSPVTSAVLPDGLERNDVSLGNLSPVPTPVSVPVSSRGASPQIVLQDETCLGGSTRTLSRTASPSEPHVNIPSHSTAITRQPISAHALSSAVSPTSLSQSGHGAGLQGGLLPAGLIVNGVLTVTRGHHSSTSDGRHLPAAANGSSQTSNPVLASRETAAPVHGLGFHADSAVLLRLEGEVRPSGTSVATAGTTPTSCPGSPSQGQQRQVLHGMTANVASSSPRRLLTGDVAPLLPVRQTLGHSCANSSVLLTQLVVSGLVSMLLIVGLTSLLQLQPPILAYIPSSSLYSLGFISLLSTVSPQQGAVDKVKGIRSRHGRPGRRPGLPATAGLARVAAMACA